MQQCNSIVMLCIRGSIHLVMDLYMNQKTGHIVMFLTEGSTLRYVMD